MTTEREEVEALVAEMADDVMIAYCGLPRDGWYSVYAASANSGRFLELLGILERIGKLERHPEKAALVRIRNKT